MNIRQFSERIGKIDDRYILEAREDFGYIRENGYHNKRRIKTRRIITLVAVLCALLTLTAAALTANWFGLKDLLILGKREVTPPLDEYREPYMADVISLAGYVDTPENRATEEWQNFISAYDPDGTVLESVGNSTFGWGSSYMYYQVYTQEMADALDEITEKYDLKLHTDIISNLNTNEKLCEQVGGDFLGENQVGTGYMYEDGTFGFDGNMELEDYGNLEYQFLRYVRGSFTDTLLNIGHLGDYKEWIYTTTKGMSVTLALSGYKALVIVNLPDSFVTINVLAGSETPGSHLFSSGPFTEEHLEKFTDSFDFSILSPARPADPDLIQADLDKVEYAQEKFELITGMEENEAQQFYSEFLALIENDDRYAVAEKIRYPACVTVEEGEFTVTNEEEFLIYYDEIFTEGLGEKIMVTRYDKERAALIPDDGMVGAAEGAIWFAKPADGDIEILTIQNSEGWSIRRIAGGITAEPTYTSAGEAYTAALENLLYANILPDGVQSDPYEPMDVNKFAVFDVNGDGADELILLFTNTYVAGQTGYVLSYQEECGMLKTELIEFPMLTFYDNGYVKAGASHNQGRAGDSLWPYTLYRYDPNEKSYEQVAMVDAWDRSVAETYMEYSFPEEADRSGTGVVYYIMTELYDLSSPMDVSDYEAWLDSRIGNALELDISYLSLTEENIEQIISA